MRPSYFYIFAFIVAYLYNVLWAIDVLGNTMRGGGRLTVSADCYHAYTEERIWGKICRPLIDAIFRPFSGKGHCQRAWETHGEQRINAPKHMAGRYVAGEDFVIPGEM